MSQQPLYPAFKDEVALADNKVLIDAINKFDLKKRIKLFAVKKYWNAKKFQMIKRQKMLEELEIKSFEKTKIIIEEANKIISWEKTPQDMQFDKLELYFLPEQLIKKQELINSTKPFKDYWLTCLKNCDVNNLIQPIDYPILSKLKKINIYINSHGLPFKHYTLEFEFESNEYFSNTIVKKYFEMLEDDLIMARGGDTLNWYEGKNITLKENPLAKMMQNDNLSSPLSDDNSNKTTGNSISNISTNNPAQSPTELPENTSFDFNVVNDDQNNKKKYEIYNQSFFLLFLNLDSETNDKLEETFLRNQNVLGAEILGEVVPYSLEYYLNIVAKRTESNENSAYYLGEESANVSNCFNNLNNMKIKKKKIED